MIKLRAPGKNRIILDPVRPSIAEEGWYRAKLHDLQSHMQKAVAEALPALYPRAHTGLLPSALHSVMLAQEEKWIQVFEDEALGIATGFVWRAIRHHDLAFSAALRKAGFDVDHPATVDVVLDAKKKDERWKRFNIKFDITQEMEAKIRKRIEENVDLIKKIPREYHEKIRKATEESVLDGRELRKYTDRLNELGAENMRHASMIARDQNNKITGFVHQLRQQDLGIEKAIWSHTSYTNNPRESHEEFDGEEYDVDEGVDFGDDFGPVQPGEAINCGCLSRSIIPGYNEEEA